MNFGSKLDEARVTNIIRRAVDLGINFIDTADVYDEGKSEQAVGRAIKGIRRDDLVIATKIRHRMGPSPNDEGLSRKHIMHGVEESLRRLGTAYIDIYYVHRPSNADMVGGFVGEPVPMRETLGALTDLVRSGKVRYIGCSNFPAWLLCKASWISERHGLENYVVCQPPYNLLNREIEREVLPLCADQGIGVVTYSPLAGGVLTGKYKAGSSPPAGTRGAAELEWFKVNRFYWEDPGNLETLRGLEEFSRNLGRPMAQVALAWLLANPAITSPIIGVSSVDQLDESVAATDLTLTKNHLDEIDRIAPPRGPYYT